MVLGSRRFGSWWLDRRLRSKGLAVLAPPVLVLVITVAASFIVERYQVAFRESGSAANRMAFQSAQVLSELLNAETGMRGYAATSMTFFLPPYNTAIATLPTDLNTLVRIAPTPAAALNATNVKALATESQDGLLPQLAAIEQGVRTHTLTDLNKALTNEDQQMSFLRRALSNIQTSERAMATAKSHDIASLESTIQPIQLVGLFVGVLGGFVAMVLFVRSIVRRIGEVGVNAHRLGVSEPLLPMPAAADEIGQVGEELRQTAVLLTQRSTDLVRAHTSALQSADTADELLSRVGHELRTPLTAVIGFGHLIDTSELSEDNAESVEQILLGGEHMLRIIEETRTPTDSPGPLDLDVGPVEVRPLVREVRALLSPLSAERHLTVAGCDDTDLVVTADYYRLKQVLINLLSNAIKYNREHGRVTITCQPNGQDWTRIAVTDTGEGITPEMLSRVFVPFDRLDAEARGVEGTGIGLSLSKTFVEAMRGRIGVDSTVGKGSTFWVDLPAAPDGRPPGVKDST